MAASNQDMDEVLPNGKTAFGDNSCEKEATSFMYGFAVCQFFQLRRRKAWHTLHVLRRAQGFRAARARAFFTRRPRIISGYGPGPTQLKQGFEGGVFENVVFRVAVKVERFKAIKAELHGCRSDWVRPACEEIMRRSLAQAQASCLLDPAWKEVVALARVVRLLCNAGKARPAGVLRPNPVPAPAILGRVLELAEQDGADMGESAVVRRAKACLVALANVTTFEGSAPLCFGLGALRGPLDLPTCPCLLSRARCLSGRSVPLAGCVSRRGGLGWGGAAKGRACRCACL